MKNYIAFLFLALFVSTGTHAANLKIGVVSMNKLSAEAPQAKLINERLEELIKEPKAELDKLMAELDDLGKKIEKDKLMSSPTQVQRMKEDYQKKMMVFKKKEASLNRGMQGAQSRASSVFLDAVLAVVKKIAKDEKYDLIMHEGFLYAGDSLNITDKVLKNLDLSFDEMKAADAKAKAEEAKKSNTNKK